MGRLLTSWCAFVLGAGCHVVFPIDGGDDAPSGDDTAGGDAPPAADALPDGSRPYLFTDGFETGVSPPWGVETETGDTLTATSAQVHTGSAAGFAQTDAVADGQAAVYFDATPQQSIYIRFWLRLEPGFAPTSYAGLVSLVDYTTGSWNNLLTWTLAPDRTIFIENEPGGMTHIPAAPIALQVDRWYRIDLSASFAVSGSVSLAIDGAPQIEEAASTGVVPPSRFAFGIIWAGTATDALGLQIDDVSIDPAPL